MNDMVGKVLGNRYEILEEIGTGGMATVYKARCRVLNRYVAVKILKDEFANDAEFIKRFQIEAQSAASLSHQNIVSIFDVGKDGSNHYIVMELIEGKTLKEVIEENGKLPWRDAVKIAAQIAAGLNQAHHNHIIHRDIKPHNIIITNDGIAKVTDFGIAKAVSNSTINAFGSTIGSVHYFSPEHARGGYTDEKSDIYSLGVVLYEMVTGKLPFEAETPVSVALKHLHEQPEEPIKIVPEIPEALNAIILKAMQKEISSRYSSAQAMYNDLTKILKNPDDISIKKNEVNKKSPTQRIPVVGENLTKDENKLKEKVKNNLEQDDDDMGKSKKGVTKSKALMRLAIFIIAAVILFFGCIKLGQGISTIILGDKQIFAVPEVEGASKEEAQRILEEAGFKMEVRASLINDLPEGYIITQDPTKGTELKKNAVVYVDISKGTEKKIVPDITNCKSTAGAKTIIENSGLVYKEAFEFSNTRLSGEIIRQEPLPNAKVEVGSEVTVYLSMGPESGEGGIVKVPNVINSIESEARRTLDDSKLLPIIRYEKLATKEDGIVLSQIPEADVYIPELSEVIVIVNKLSGEIKNDNYNVSGENKNSVEEDKIENNKGNVPENNNGGTSSNAPIAKREVTIDLSKMGERQTFNVKVVLESNLIGKKVEYESVHSRNEGKIKVLVTDVQGAMIRIYADDVLVSEMPLD